MSDPDDLLVSNSFLFLLFFFLCCCLLFCSSWSCFPVVIIMLPFVTQCETFHDSFSPSSILYDGFILC